MSDTTHARPTIAEEHATIRRRADECPHVRDRLLHLLSLVNRPMPEGLTYELRYSDCATDHADYPDAVSAYLTLVQPAARTDRALSPVFTTSAAYLLDLWISFEPGAFETVGIAPSARHLDYMENRLAPSEITGAVEFTHRAKSLLLDAATALGLLPGRTPSPSATIPGIELVGEAPVLTIGEPSPASSFCEDRIASTAKRAQIAVGSLQRAERFAERASPMLAEDRTAADMEFDENDTAVTCSVRGTADTVNGPLTVTVSRGYWPSGNDRAAFIDVQWPEGNSPDQLNPSVVPGYVEALRIATERAQMTGLLD